MLVIVLVLVLEVRIVRQESESVSVSSWIELWPCLPSLVSVGTVYGETPRLMVYRSIPIPIPIPIPMDLTGWLEYFTEGLGTQMQVL